MNDTHKSREGEEEECMKNEATGARVVSREATISYHSHIIMASVTQQS